MRRVLIPALLTIACLPICLATPVAVAAVPPGHSGADQYSEGLPSGGGNTTTHELEEAGSRQQAGSGSGAALDRGDAARLRAAGADGKAAAALAAAGLPKGSSEADGGRSGSAAGSSSGLAQVAGQLTGTADSDGMGVLLPLLILMTAVLALGFGFSRRNRTHPHD